MSAGVELRANHISMDFKTGPRVLHDVSLRVGSGKFVSIVGPSGCGKTTLLRICAGLIPPTAGGVEVLGKGAINPADLGLVLQRPALLPWRSVLDNVLLPARILNLPMAGSRARARELIELVGLAGSEDKRPAQLSGGMQQRVAIARALLHDPGLLLLDEPFGALDAITREQLNLDLQRICRSEGKSVLLVTHGVEEAVFLSNTVIVMGRNPGRISATVSVDIPRPRSWQERTDAFTNVETAVRDALIAASESPAGVPAANVSRGA
jgi:NitT/TauT family transport system ATP-binding protein